MAVVNDGWNDGPIQLNGWLLTYMSTKDVHGMRTRPWLQYWKLYSKGRAIAALRPAAIKYHDSTI